jgi:hypothetical protein
MKVNIIRDANKKVVATFESPNVGGRPTVKSVLKPGESVDEVEAPENYKADIKAFYAQHSR